MGFRVVGLLARQWQLDAPSGPWQNASNCSPTAAAASRESRGRTRFLLAFGALNPKA